MKLKVEFNRTLSGVLYRALSKALSKVLYKILCRALYSFFI